MTEASFIREGLRPGFVITISAWLAVFLIPFISLPVMPSVYRPISAYFLILPSVIFMLGYKKFDTFQDRVVALFVFYTLIYGFIAGYFSYDFIFSGYVTELAAVMIGMLAYIGFRYVFSEFGLEWFFRVSSFSYKFVVVIGFLEVLSLVGILPYGLKELINIAFSGKTHGRIQLTTMEAAWGARVLLFLFVVYLYSKFDAGLKRIFFLSCGILLFLSTFSVAMMSYLALGLLFYLLMVYKFKGLIYLIVLSLFAYLSLVGLLMVVETFDLGGYHLNRIEALLYGDFYQLKDMLYYDQSIFIRIGYPVLAVYVYMDNLFGVGLGQYSTYFSDYLMDLFGGSVLAFPEVFGDVYDNDGDPRSLPAKVLSELSIIGLIFYFYIFYVAYSRRCREYDSFKTLFICLAFASGFTIGTWAYMYVWMALAMMPASSHGRRDCE